MKKMTGKPQTSNAYKCRKCDRTSFKNSMEFTKHLKSCKGPVLPEAPSPTLSNEGVVAILTELSEKAGEFQAAIGQAIKRLR